MGRELWLIDSERQLVRIAENGNREALGVSIGENAEAIEAGLKERMVGLTSVGVLLDSTLCYWEPVSGGSKSVKSSEEIKFELEEKIPFDAEDVHFVVEPDCFPGFVVATELAPLKSLVEALQRSEVEAEFLVPLALAEWQLARTAWGERDSLYVCQEGERFDLLVQRGKKLVGWSLAWGAPSLVARCWAVGGESGAVWAKVDEQAGAELRRAYGERVTVLAAVGTLPTGWTKKRGPWVGNLAVGPLESRKLREGLQRALQMVLLLALVSVVGLAGATYYQATLDHEAAVGLRDTQQRRLRRSHVELPRRRTEEWFVAEIAAKRSTLAAVRDWGERPSLLAEEFPLGVEATAAAVSEAGRAARLEVLPGRVLLNGEFADVGPAERVLKAAGWDVVPQPLGGGSKVKTVEARRSGEQKAVRQPNAGVNR
ncbi:MAG: hypothetical protein Q8M16_02835 [Pirellulaceae bacterium]|nr:hypothetical protein [Pirellulaceae bacterium]